MKRILFLLAVFLVFTPMTAQADNFDARIEYFVAYFDTDEECAVQTEITGIDGGLLNGTEAILLNGIEWANTQELIDVQGNSGYQVGDKISWGTSALALKLNYNFDIELRADFCQDLEAGDFISYRTSFGSEVSGYNIGTPNILTSWNFNPNSGGYDTWDLSTNTFTITGFGGSITIVDGVPQGSTNGGNGCRLTHGPSALSGLSGWALLLSVLIIPLILRRSKHCL